MSLTSLFKDSGELIVLSILADAPQYGYAIAKEVAARSDEQVKLTPGVMYPLLRKLEKDKLISAEWEAVVSDRADEGSEGRRRKWYRLTPKGKRRLDQQVRAHHARVALLELFLPGAEASTNAEEGAR